MIGNPIIAKELIQAAHHKRTYLIRAGFPALVALVLGFELWDVLPRYGQDWRAIATVSRALFTTLVWLEFVAFSFLGFVGATLAVHQEWANRTMEVLCATPLSRRRILHGKFVAVLSQVLMVALALLPITAVLYYIGRLPREMAVGSFAVIVGSVLFFSSLGLLQAVMMRPREGSTPVPFSILGPFLLAVIFLDCYVFVRHPLLDALIPPWALVLVTVARPPAGWSVGGFAALSFAALAGVSLAALLLAPVVFRFTLTRTVSGQVRVGRWARLGRFLRGRRPRMKAGEDPFVWQEKGGSTRFTRWALWLVYGVFLLFYVGAGIYWQDFSFFGEEWFYGVLLVSGVVTVTVAAAAYGASVFAREKSQRTAEALLLTGHQPARYYWAKVRGLYWALRSSLLLVGIVILLWFVGPYFFVRQYYGGSYAVGRRPEEVWTLLGLLELLLVGPAVAAVVGMVFSALARSAQRAVGAMVTGGVLAFVLGWMLSVVYEAIIQGYREPDAWLLPLIILTALFFLLNRTWTPVRLSLLLALSALLLFSGEFAVGKSVDALHAPGAAWYTAIIFGTNVVVGVLALLWLVLGLRTFDAGLAGAPARFFRWGWRRGEGSRGTAV